MPRFRDGAGVDLGKHLVGQKVHPRVRESEADEDQTLLSPEFLEHRAHQPCLIGFAVLVRTQHDRFGAFVVSMQEQDGTGLREEQIVRQPAMHQRFVLPSSVVAVSALRAHGSAGFEQAGVVVGGDVAAEGQPQQLFMHRSESAAVAARAQMLGKWDWLRSMDAWCLFGKWDWLRGMDARCLSHFPKPNALFASRYVA
jgi:hypothetical protein